MPTPLITDTQAYLDYLTIRVERNHEAANTAWINSNMYLIFLMQIGFNFLEVAAARHKNYIYTIFKNLLNVCVVSLGWWLIGYGFAYGESSNGGIGTTFFATAGFKDVHHYNSWMINFAFALTSFSISTGVILERCTIWVNMLHALYVTVLVYPFTAHWCWNKDGWLKAMGYIDFAGCGPIHMVGGASGLAALLVVGSRKHRYDPKKAVDFTPSNTPFFGLATIFLWYCWYGFNCGSLEKVVNDKDGEYSRLVGLVALNSTIAATTGGITAFIVSYLKKRGTKEEYDAGALYNGILVGLVACGACVNNTHPWCCMFIGIISGLIYLVYQWASQKLKLDDPLDAIPIHMGCGSWGVVAMGWFDLDKGIIFNNGGKQFGIQLLGMLIFFAWSFVMTLILFLLLKYCNIHRVDDEIEEAGADIKYCGQLAFHFDEITCHEYAKIFYNHLNVQDFFHDGIMQKIKKLEKNRVKSQAELDYDQKMLEMELIGGNMPMVNGPEKKEIKPDNNLPSKKSRVRIDETKDITSNLTGNVKNIELNNNINNSNNAMDNSDGNLLTRNKADSTKKLLDTENSNDDNNNTDKKKESDVHKELHNNLSFESNSNNNDKKKESDAHKELNNNVSFN